MIWRLWCKALGEKATPNDHESDRVAIIRSVIFLSYLTTNLFIISGVVRHWNDEVQSDVYPTKEEIRLLQQAKCSVL